MAVMIRPAMVDDVPRIVDWIEDLRVAVNGPVPVDRSWTARTVAGLIADDAGIVLVSDGGGKAMAARRPITGADKVARFIVAVTAQGMALPGLRIEIADLNGAPAAVAWADGLPLMTMSLVVADGLVTQILLVVNPDKLGHLQERGQERKTERPG